MQTGDYTQNPLTRRSVSEIAILRHLTFMASPKSFLLNDLSCLPAEKLPAPPRSYK